MKVISTRLILLLIIVNLQNVYAQLPTVTQAAPPWMAYSNNFFMTVFQLKFSDVQPLLPKHIKAKVNNLGRVTAMLEVYETKRIYGLPNYKMAFIAVEVKGYDSSNGMPGHWPLWGNVSPKPVARNMQRYFSLPFEFQPNIAINKEAGLHSATIGAPDKALIHIKMRQLKDKTFSAEGVVNMLSKSQKGLFLTAVPWFSNGYAGELLSLDINADDIPALKLLEGQKPLFSVISINQTFTYSQPVLQ